VTSDKVLSVDEQYLILRNQFLLTREDVSDFFPLGPISQFTTIDTNFKDPNNI